MKEIRFIPQTWACAILALSAAVASTNLSANIITMEDYGNAGNTVSCVQGCLGFLDTSPTSTNNATAHDFPKEGNPTDELAALNLLLGAFNPARELMDYANKTETAGDGFSTSLQYFSIKQGTLMWFFENTSGGSLTVALDGNTADYSHWTEYGVSPVPVPAAVWLFGTALLGFIGMSRRTKV